MFSQQGIKRLNLHNPFPQYAQAQAQANITSGGLTTYSDFQAPYSNFNDNMSLYSSNSTATSISNPNKRKSIAEDFNSILISCIEEFLPKMAEDCAEAVFMRITNELERQAKEIENLKSQLEELKNLSIGNSLSRLGNKNSTPMKKFDNINKKIRDINSTLSAQTGMMKGNMDSLTNSSSYLYSNLQEKLKILQMNIEEEKMAAEKLNHSLKDRYVDLVGMKNFVEEKVDYLLSDIKLQANNHSNHSETKVFSDIIASIDQLLDEASAKKEKKIYTNANLQIQSGEKISELARDFTEKSNERQVSFIDNNTCLGYGTGRDISNYAFQNLQNQKQPQQPVNYNSGLNNFSLNINQNKNRKGGNQKFLNGKFTF
jgi:hypothetical protein